MLYNVNQPYVYIYTLLLKSPSHHLPFHPSRSSQSRAELPMLYGRVPLSIYLTRGSLYMSTLLFQFILPTPSTPASTNPFSTSAYYSCPANRFVSAIFLDSIYVH